ncbi:MAG: ribosomal RNA small subunit methyltransferase A [Bacilli bacterium]|nr:ribosomal RNA small subunit methyltransferase A [Bacilli bacterium]
MIEHNFKKKYGQNFLNDKNVVNKIVSVAETSKEDLIIEIGPGGGALTEELIKKSKVLAYEIDKELEDNLKSKIKSDNFYLIFDNFLNRNIKEDIKNIKYNNLYVIANLPYYITTPIINKIIEDKIDVKKMVLMVQKEVGERFSAKSGSKDYSSISIYLNYFFDINKEFTVSRNSFFPKPNVDSIIISFTKKEKKYNINNEDKFFKLIKDSFVQKRKTLKNNLKKYDFKIIEKILVKNNLPVDVRAENIPIEVFIEISNNI